MNTFITLKAHLDAAWNQLTESDLYRRAQAEATEAFRELRTPPRIYQRLDELQESIFETAALMSDDDIAEMLDTIASEKDVKMAEYKLPAEPDAPPIKVGDTGLTAEQVWGLPEGTVIWPERAEEREPWMRYEDYWESVSIFADNAGELQCACGDGFTVLRLGGGE